ncbi:ATPase [Candidatus Woesearchaeota archaeon]|nr:ATPase [Candidatus Woesearchaeota archaeon]
MAVETLTTGAGLLGIGAGLAIGLAAIGTGLAQQQIIAAVLGAISEDPKMFGKGLFFIVLPETLVIFGLVIALMLMGNIG